MLQRIWTLIIKEILAVWRDKKSRTVLIVPPLVQLFVFSMAATLDVKNVAVALLNRDNGAQSFEIIERIKGSPFFNKIIYLDSVNQIRPTIDEQRAFLVLHFDEQFSRLLEAGEPASIQMILDGRKSNTTQIIAGYLARIIDQYNQDFAHDRQLHIQPTQLFPRNWYNPNLLYYWYNVPSLCGLLTMLIALVVTALSVARERELGTFDQLLVSPLQPIEILIGKTIPAIIIGMMEGTIIILAAIFIFQIPLTGSLVTLYASMFVFICSIVGIGLFISSLCQTQQQAILGTYVFMSPAVLLSGFATPIENMPDWLQTITYLNPLRYFLVVAKGIFLKAMPAAIVFENTWPVALIALFNMTAAMWMFRKRLQ